MAIQTRIKQRFDPLSSWIQNDIVLLKGELAVVDCGNQTRFKIGDGLNHFTQLPFVDQSQLCTQWVAADAMSQGIHAKSVPYAFAAGAYLCANANFSQALGFDAQTVSSDTYSFVWNGDDTRAIGDYYISHGKGTFSINALSGLSGIFIGEQSLAELLDAKSENKITIDDRISGICQQSDLSVVKLGASEYSALLASNSLLSNALYIVEDDYVDAYGERIKNVASPIDLGDAANREYVDQQISGIVVPTDLSDLANSPGYLTAHQSLSSYYQKSETSSASEISTALTSVDVGNKVFIDDRISGIVQRTDLSIVHLSSSEYQQLCANGELLSNALYIVEDSFTNNYSKQIKNVAAPTDQSDAATKGYVDQQISSIHIPDDLSSFTNSPGYIVSDDISCYCYVKNETSSAAEISTAISNTSKVVVDGNVADLSVFQVGIEEYAEKLSTGILSNELYVVSLDHLDAFGQRVQNVAPPSELSDAANKEYVDSAVSSIQLPTDLSAFTNSPGYLISNDMQSTLGSISKALISQIEAPKASVISIQQTLVQLLNILSGGSANL